MGNRKPSWIFLAIAVLLLATACATSNHAPVRDLEKPKKVTWGSHRVQAGETLYSIAWRYGRDYRELARANGIKKPYLLRPGQKISLAVATGKSPASRKVASSAGKQTSSKDVPVRAKPKPKAKTVAGPIHWRWPAKGKLIGRYSRWGTNKGIDIQAKSGAPVLAAADGVVVYAGSGLIGYGNLVIIKHSATYLSAYAHNKKIVVREQKKVKVGDKIAEIGSTGSKISKLHFEIRKSGKPVDPLRYLPK